MPETAAAPVTPESPETTVDDADFDWGEFGELPTDDPEQGDEESFTIKVNGEDVQVTLEEALQGYMRQSDYTQKTQQLAQYRQAMQPLENLAVALDSDPEGTVRLLAEELGVKLTPAQVKEVLETDPATEDLLAASLKDLQARQDRFEQQQALQTARTEIIRDLARLQEQYGEFDADELVTYATERKITDLDTAFAAWQWQKRAQEAPDNTEAIVAAKRRQAVVDASGGRASGSLAPGAGKKMTLRESVMAAIQAH